MHGKTYEQIVQDIFTGNISVEQVAQHPSLNQYLNDVTNENIALTEAERLAVVKLLVQNGATEHINNSGILLSAILNKWNHIVEFLLSQPDINIGNIVEHHINQSTHHIKTLWRNFSRKQKPLLNPINQPNEIGLTLAHQYVSLRNTSMLEGLLKKPELDLSIRDKNGYTPIAAALYYCLNCDSSDTQILTLLISSAKHCLSSTPYYILRPLFNNVLSKPNLDHTWRLEAINFILENSTLMITDEDIIAANQLHKDLGETLKRRQGLQSNWDLKKMSGFKELPGQQNIKAEDRPQDTNKEQFNYFNIFAPLALNILFHITHKIVPVYISSPIALFSAYHYKQNHKDEPHLLNLYNNIILASVANLSAYGYLNSQSKTMHTMYGICTFALGICYGLTNYIDSQHHEK